MNIDTEKSHPRVLFDTNILISALVFGGDPARILMAALEGEFRLVTSNILIAELVDVVNKKFPLSTQDLELLKEQIYNKFDIVSPTDSLDVLNDTDDNRVLEAAIKGECEFIVTGDRELLDLGRYKKIKIVSVSDFLNLSFVNKLDN